MGLYTALARPLVFRLPAEASHGLAENALRVSPAWALAGAILRSNHPGLKVEIAGMNLPNPVGMAAGFDKNCRVIGSLLSLGFGFAVGGTVTLHPRPGNARPRMFRDQRRRALVNALGFPGSGLARAQARLAKLPPSQSRRAWVSVSGSEEQDILECHRTLEPLVSAVEVNISSPNTAGLRVFQEPGRLRSLIKSITERKKRPLFVKMPRFDGAGADRKLLELGTVAIEAGAEGLVVANTLPVEDPRLAVGRGGLSGEPLFDSTLRFVESLRSGLPAHATLIACGGVTTARDVRRLMSAGAAGVQLYTAFVYEGVGLPGKICRQLSR